MEPKYLLVFETKDSYSEPYTIYEQMATKMPPKDVPVGMGMTMKQEQPDAIATRFYARYDTIHRALMALGTLNDGEPVVLAYSTKPVDNTFTV